MQLFKYLETILGLFLGISQFKKKNSYGIHRKIKNIFLRETIITG